METSHKIDELRFMVYTRSSHVAELVIDQMGGWEAFSENAPDIANGGADAGWVGFTYHADTVAFAKKNQRPIMKMATEEAQNFGMNVLEMIAGFRCLRDAGVTTFEVADVLLNGEDDGDVATWVYNALAWYALEEMAHDYVRIAEDWAETEARLPEDTAA